MNIAKKKEMIENLYTKIRSRKGTHSVNSPLKSPPVSKVYLRTVSKGSENISHTNSSSYKAHNNNSAFKSFHSSKAGPKGINKTINVDSSPAYQKPKEPSMRSNFKDQVNRENKKRLNNSAYMVQTKSNIDLLLSREETLKSKISAYEEELQSLIEEISQYEIIEDIRNLECEISDYNRLKKEAETTSEKLLLEIDEIKREMAKYKREEK